MINITNKHVISSLLAIGLTQEEAILYSFLVESGASDVTTVAKNLSITRVTAYALIKELLRKDFILKTKPKKRYLYQAHDPEMLLSLFQNAYKNGAQALSMLSIKHKKNLFVPEVKIYSGVEQVRSMYDDVALTLPKGGTFFRYTSRTKDVGYSPVYAKLRKEKELERMVITNQSKSDKKGKDSDRFIKTVPKDFAFDDNVTVLIYGEKIAYMDFNSDTGITIESPQLARFQEKIFKLLWKRL